MTDIIFARAGNILHILTDDGLLCDCRDWKIVDRATYRDDLLCGTCLDSWQSSAVNPQGQASLDGHQKRWGSPPCHLHLAATRRARKHGEAASRPSR